jgi:hypothetical protein
LVNQVFYFYRLKNYKNPFSFVFFRFAKSPA